jgi:hypothetical protein
MMTTKSIGIGADEANPKPVRHVNWTGQPMKEGDNYWGESAPKGDEAVPETEPVVRVSRPRKRRKPLGKMTEEARKAISERMRAYWSGKRSAAAEETTN